MASNDVNTILDEWDTYPNGRLEHLLGTIKEFVNKHSETGDPVDQRVRRAILVKNRSGTTLLAGQCCTWKAGYGGVGVDKCAASSAAKFDGVVAPLIPSAGVASLANFWLIIEGPAKFINDANAALSEFVNLIVSPSVAGSVRAQAVVPATGGDAQINARIGKTEAAADASATFWGEVLR